MISILQQTTTRAIMITGFVFMMMVIIEYLNVMSRGVWQRGLRGSRLRQYLLASFLGATPGCLGAFTVVSLDFRNPGATAYIGRISASGNMDAGESTPCIVAACLVGLIPESGPHLLFLTLFVEGAIPFSIFLASSIVQDGHGTLPLLAESQGAFLKVKAINFAVGLMVGGIGYVSGW